MKVHKYCRIVFQMMYTDVRISLLVPQSNDFIIILDSLFLILHPAYGSVLKSYVNCCFIDFRAEREKRDRLEREGKKKVLKEEQEKKKELEKKRQEEAELKSYNTLMNSETMAKYDDGNDSDDFM